MFIIAYFYKNWNMLFLFAYSLLGEKMKKAMDKLFTVDKKVVIFLFIISFIGVLTGSLFMTVLSSEDKLLVADTLSSFLETIEPTNYIASLTNNLIINTLFIGVIWLLGFSVIGLPVVVVLIFYKAFSISFTLSSFVANYGLKGSLLGFLYNFPHQFVIFVIYLYVGCYAIKVSLALVNSIMKRKTIDFKAIMNRYLLVLIVSLLIVVIMTLLETFLTPYLLKIVVNVL